MKKIKRQLIISNKKMNWLLLTTNHLESQAANQRAVIGVGIRCWLCVFLCSFVEKIRVIQTDYGTITIKIADSVRQ